MLDERYWSKVNKTETCWLWTAGTDSYGYGLFRFDSKLEKAHRLSFIESKGYIPTYMVLHNCNVRCCVRPSHLYEGDFADNVADRIACGNNVRGARSGRAKLTDALVIQLRSDAKYMRVNDIAVKYGIKACTVSNIVARRIWRHI